MLVTVFPCELESIEMCPARRGRFSNPRKVWSKGSAGIHIAGGGKRLSRRRINTRDEDSRVVLQILVKSYRILSHVCRLSQERIRKLMLYINGPFLDERIAKVCLSGRNRGR